MKTLTLTAALAIGSGTELYLTKEQIDVREHNIEVIKKDKHGAKVRALKPIEFKAGEIIKMDEDAIPKDVLGELVVQEEAKAAEAQKRKAAAAAAERAELLAKLEGEVIAASALLDAAQAALLATPAEEVADIETKTKAVADAQAGLDAAEAALEEARK